MLARKRSCRVFLRPLRAILPRPDKRAAITSHGSRPLGDGKNFSDWDPLFGDAVGGGKTQPTKKFFSDGAKLQD